MSRRAIDRIARKHFRDDIDNLPQLLDCPTSSNYSVDAFTCHSFNVEHFNDIPSFENVLELLNSDESSSGSDLNNEESTDVPLPNINHDDLSMSLAEELLVCFVIFNLSHSCMTFILTCLRRHGVSVPPSVYHLKKLKEKVNWDKMNINNGQLGHLSVMENIQFCLRKGLLSIGECFKPFKLDISINIDGLPLYRSSNLTLWTILCRIGDIARPFPLSVFCGVGKPDVTVFLSNLCDELSLMKTSGIVVNGHRIFLGCIKIICDSPARAYVQCLKGHNSFDGCSYCRIKGYWSQGRVVFPAIRASSRTDVDYCNFAENNQLQLSPISSICGLYSDFPPDYMHCVCLGVVRKLFHFYLLPQKGHRLPCKLSQDQQQSLSQLALRVSTFIPSDFQRRLRSFKELLHFKATEFRTLVLYLGPYLLKDFLLPQFYEHFLFLHFAIYVYVSSRHKHLYSHAQRCIEIFVHRMSELFGTNSLSYNTHVIHHLYEFLASHGPLDNFSAFPFENYLSLIKRRVRPTRFTFQHTLNILSNIRDIYSEPSGQQLIISDISPNNCVLLADYSIILVTQINDSLVAGKKLQFSRSLYTLPYDSATIQIGYYRIGRTLVKNVKPLTKAICIPMEGEFLVIPYA
jgi:hypothetical protein